MSKTQRIRDPIHNLIIFQEKDDIDQLAWKLINTREFQRLRRIKQLGLSEFVFPGATHTRFAHCIGVFHTARQLMAAIERKFDAKNEDRRRVALIAALLHDIGHGPFSHTFENAQRKRKINKTHEEWGADIITGETEVMHVLESYQKEMAVEVAALLKAKEPQDLYSQIVSSQFDADRLDYLRRDRYMTGTSAGAIDFDWLLDCLEVKTIVVGGNSGKGDDDIEKIDGLCISYKGLQSAENYLLARFHLYSQVYTHKTTRGFELLLGAFLVQFAKKLDQNPNFRDGFGVNDPLVVYLQDSDSLINYLALGCV